MHPRVSDFDQRKTHRVTVSEIRQEPSTISDSNVTNPTYSLHQLYMIDASTVSFTDSLLICTTTLPPATPFDEEKDVTRLIRMADGRVLVEKEDMSAYNDFAHGTDPFDDSFILLPTCLLRIDTGPDNRVITVFELKGLTPLYQIALDLNLRDMQRWDTMFPFDSERWDVLDRDELDEAVALDPNYAGEAERLRTVEVKEGIDPYDRKVGATVDGSMVVLFLSENTRYHHVVDPKRRPIWRVRVPRVGGRKEMGYWALMRERKLDGAGGRVGGWGDVVPMWVPFSPVVSGS
ncbi:hypothetical protein HDV00_007424 [Rhizophlyctis rosea]|nr:hypothetical protein HDV00_007424 [Rhizophlyctis rosea]